MRLLKVALVIAASLSYLGSYLQEKKRLAATLRLPVTEALARYEAAQHRREKVLVVVTGALMAGALAALVVRLRS